MVEEQGMVSAVPVTYSSFREEYPEVYAAYEQLGTAVHNQGPLDPATRSLIKLALAVGIGAEGAVHAHTRKCLAAGHSPEAIRQVVLLAIPTVGFPAAMAALSWVNDILNAK